MQLLDSVVEPEHWDPAPTGAGFVHDLVLVFEPAPQVVEQLPHDDQLVKPPFSEKKIMMDLALSPIRKPPTTFINHIKPYDTNRGHQVQNEIKNNVLNIY